MPGLSVMHLTETIRRLRLSRLSITAVKGRQWHCRLSEKHSKPIVVYKKVVETKCVAQQQQQHPNTSTRFSLSSELRTARAHQWHNHIAAVYVRRADAVRARLWFSVGR